MLRNASPVGQLGLIAKLGLQVPSPAVGSYVGPGARRTLVEDTRTLERYPVTYFPDDSLIGHLRFALKHEPLDIGVMVAALGAMDKAELENWVRAEPTGAYARRAWFLYETFLDDQLDVPDAGTVTYAPVLNPDLHIVSTGKPSRRQKITDNLLGGPSFCPFVRKTARLQQLMNARVDREARALVEGCDPDVLARAVNYLFTKETRSSFAIEGENPSGTKTERFVAALRHAGEFDPSDEESLVKLQNSIVDHRYAAKSYRDFQNFVGETVGGYREVVHFVCPKPEDVSSLMSGWAQMCQRLRSSTDPVIEAALAAFAFVFIHPFEDGNGRIHRYLIHHVLAAEGFSPPGVLFPVSAAIVRDRKSYDQALESFSRPVMELIDWQFTPEKEVQVINRTDRLYRFFDATKISEFLYEKVVETVEKDLKEELDFVGVYDAAVNAVMERIDMPDRKASLFVRLCMQNSGRLSKAKRPMFDELSDQELSELEAVIQAIMEHQGD